MIASNIFYLNFFMKEMQLNKFKINIIRKFYYNIHYSLLKTQLNTTLHDFRTITLQKIKIDPNCNNNQFSK